jgi:CheY-like chemotaxis protein
MKPQLLVVDDEAPVVKLLKAFLSSQGAEVLTTTDSQEALRYVDEKSFDAIFLDIRMPVLNGIDLTKYIRASALNKKAPIVILTGSDDVDTMREAFRVGATCFLGKPVTRDRVRSLFLTVCGPVFLERRRQARVPLHTKVRCVWGARGQGTLLADSVNIGENGMLLQPSAELELGQELDLELVLPSAKTPLHIRARITCKEPTGCMEVEFVDMAITAREAIRNHIIGALQRSDGSA